MRRLSEVTTGVCYGIGELAAAAAAAVAAAAVMQLCIFMSNCENSELVSYFRHAADFQEPEAFSVFIPEFLN